MNEYNLSFLDKIFVFFHIYRDNEEVRKYLNVEAEKLMNENKTKGLIQVSNAIKKEL